MSVSQFEQPAIDAGIDEDLRANGIIPQVQPAMALQRFEPTDAAIAAMRSEYMPLAINGVNDADGYKAVHNARMVVRSHRVEVEKVRKELKADALEYGRKVDAEAKRITAMLAPIEDHLAVEEDNYITEKERIRNAARLAAEAEAKAKADAEAARLKAEQEAATAKLRAEQEAVRIERERLAEEQRKLAEQQRQIQAEKDRIAAEERKRLQAIENERIRAEAAEKARIETEQRLAREAAAAKAREEAAAAAAKVKAEAAEAARLKAEALRPDREKLAAFADMVAQLDIPAVSPAAAGHIATIRLALQDVATIIRGIVRRME